MIKVRLFCISRLDVAYLKKLDTHTHTQGLEKKGKLKTQMSVLYLSVRVEVLLHCMKLFIYKLYV